MKIYHDEILRLAKSDIGRGELVGGVSARLTNPLCGDECALYLQTNGDVITAVTQQTRGCVLCLAAAAKLILLARETPQLTAMRNAAQAFTDAFKNNGDLPTALTLFSPVMERKSRHTCVLLPYRAFLEMTRF